MLCFGCMCSVICFEVGPSQCSARSRLVHLFVVESGLLDGHVVPLVLNVHLFVLFLKKSVKISQSLVLGVCGL